MPSPNHLDAPLLRLTDSLCRARSYWLPPADGPSPGEGEVAALIADNLERHPWLRVATELAAPGRPNVYAADCDDADVDLLIIGHLDTVPPTPGWTVDEFTVRDGRYHALGAADTKAGIAAVLDAVAKVGPTRGLGLLLYADEEYHFVGMRDFLARHPDVRPARVLSVCGPPAQMLTGCRGIIELELVVRGRPGHASRPWSGTSAVSALQAVTDRLQQWVPAQNTLHRSVCNLSAIHAGSLAAEVVPTGHGPPPMLDTANRIPDVAWALVEVRPGGPEVSAGGLHQQAQAALSAFNTGAEHDARLARFDVHFELTGYQSGESAITPFVRHFSHLHGGEHSDPGTSGYVDIAMLAGERGCGAVCMGPLSGGAHAPDEWVDLEGLGAYRDGMVALLADRKR